MSTESPEARLRTFQRELPVKLNEHELQLYGKQLAERVNQEKLQTEAKQNWNKQQNAEIQKTKNEIARIATARAKGEELRPVNCAERFQNGVIEIVRLDRKPPEVVEVRPADMRDLQPNLPGVDDEDHLEDTDGDEVDPTVDEETPGGDGEMRASSSGDQVYAGAPDDRDDETERTFGGAVDQPDETDDDTDRNGTQDDDEPDEVTRARAKKRGGGAAPKRGGGGGGKKPPKLKR